MSDPATPILDEQLLLELARVYMRAALDELLRENEDERRRSEDQRIALGVPE